MITFNTAKLFVIEQLGLLSTATVLRPDTPTRRPSPVPQGRRGVLPQTIKLVDRSVGFQPTKMMPGNMVVAETAALFKSKALVNSHLERAHTVNYVYIVSVCPNVMFRDWTDSTPLMM
ncbi:MAG TPA: hypothetical protein DHV36_00325 [Desulfobacteraceae bacterium]|nr:hypothetical protein [Desulfobacteraceae bacterium]